jgi:hypothetical protein
MAQTLQEVKQQIPQSGVDRALQSSSISSGLAQSTPAQ